MLKQEEHIVTLSGFDICRLDQLACQTFQNAGIDFNTFDSETPTSGCRFSPVCTILRDTLNGHFSYLDLKSLGFERMKHLKSAFSSLTNDQQWRLFQLLISQKSH